MPFRKEMLRGKMNKLFFFYIGTMLLVLLSVPYLILSATQDIQYGNPPTYHIYCYDAKGNSVVAKVPITMHCAEGCRRVMLEPIECGVIHGH